MRHFQEYVHTLVTTARSESPASIIYIALRDDTDDELNGRFEEELTA